MSPSTPTLVWQTYADLNQIASKLVEICSGVLQLYFLRQKQFPAGVVWWFQSISLATHFSDPDSAKEFLDFSCLLASNWRGPSWLTLFWLSITSCGHTGKILPDLLNATKKLGGYKSRHRQRRLPLKDTYQIPL
jgi:hypothetical protein